jgi:GNAT superfamily N-acetyltransferase
LSIHDGFFDDEDEIRSYLQKNARLFIYRHGATPVACGIVKQVVECRNDYDVGMVVAPSERGKGYGAQVVNHLKHFCIAQGWNPIAGCSVDNPASKRSLEHAGFVSKHQLIKFTRN